MHGQMQGELSAIVTVPKKLSSGGILLAPAKLANFYDLNTSKPLPCWAASDHRLLEIVGLSLRVTYRAPVIGTFNRFVARGLVSSHKVSRTQCFIVALNALMGLPSVVVRRHVYLALSRSGPLGSYGLLFSPGRFWRRRRW